MAAVIDPAFVQWITSEGNRAHRSMGTELVAIEPDGVAIALAWRADLADASDALATGVIAALLDHACSLAAVIALGDPERFGTTLSLRVDHLEPAAPRQGAQVSARATHLGADLVTVTGTVVHPGAPGRAVAAGLCKVATAR